MATIGKKPNRVKLFFKRNASSYLFLLPFLILYFTLTVFPIAQTIQISLSKWDMMSPDKPFVGLKNFRDLFVNDPLFWISVKATLEYIFSNVPLKIGIGLILALALNKKLPGKAFHRTAIFIPIVINIAAVGLLFQWIFNPRMGALNYYLQRIGIGPQEWLIKPTWTMAVVVLVSIWWSVAFNAIVFLAGLQSIPGGLYEAAKIDGANKRQTFWHITLPCLKGTTMFVCITQIIGSFQAFGNIYMLTGGGPSNATRVLMIHLYETGFYYFRMGPAAAMAIILFIIIMLLTLVILTLFKRQVEY